MNIQVEEMHSAGCVGRGVELPCLLGYTASQSRRVFTNLEALQTLYFQEGFITSA